jgi:chorismate-pyruvate lyase
MNVFTDDSMTRIFTNVLSSGLKVRLLIAERQII